MTDQQPDPLDGEITSHLRQRSDEIILPAPDPAKPPTHARRATRRRIGAGVGALAVTALTVGGLTMIGNDDGGDELASEAPDVESVDEEAAAESALAVPSSGLSFGGGSSAAAVLGLEGEAHISSISAIDGGWLAVVQRWEPDGPGSNTAEFLRSADGHNWESGPGPELGPDEQIHDIVVEGDLMVATGAAFPEGFFERIEAEESYAEPYRFESPTPKVWVSTDGGATWTGTELSTDRPDLPHWAHPNTWLGNAAIHGSTILLTGSSYVDVDVPSLLGEDPADDYDVGYGWSRGPGGEFQVEIWRDEGSGGPEIHTASELGIEGDVFELLGQGASVIWRTTDGVNWEKQDGPADVSLEQIITGPGGLYSVGHPRYDEFGSHDAVAEEEFEGPALWRSEDGSSWEKVDDLPVDGDGFIQRVFEFGDDIAIVTEEWPNGPTLWRFDGQTWHRESVSDLVATGDDEQLWFERVETGPAGTLIMANLEVMVYGPDPLVDEIIIEKDGLVLRQPVHGPRDTDPSDVFAIIEDADGNVLAEYRYENSGPEGPVGLSWEEDGNTYYSIYSDPETGDELMRLTDQEMEGAWQQAYPEDAYDDYEDDYTPPRRILLWRSTGATEWLVLNQAEALGFEGWTQAAAVGESEVMIIVQEELDHETEMPAVFEELEMAMEGIYEQFENGEITEEELREAEEAVYSEWEPQLEAAQESMPQPETHVFVGSLD
ncbi:MAG: hypothetical protein GY929_18880 [Actinomycetia bacterium]|nr:hypothetical protein [Actinomycetes bacterium]